MKNLSIIGNQCRANLVSIGIYPAHISVWKINSRAKSRWGRCSRKGNAYSIEIASCLLQDDAPAGALESTIYHELIHSCDGCMNHGAEWQRLANQASAAFGVTIKRTDSAQDKGYKATENPLKKAIVYHHAVSCLSCGRSWKYQRANKIVRCCELNTAKCPCGASNFLVRHF